MDEYKNPYLGVDNPYLTQKVDQAQGDLIRNYNLIAQPQFNSAMVRSGSFGNSGVQQLNENAQRDLQANMGRISTDLRGADYNNQQNMYRWDQEFGRSLYNDAYGQQQQDLQTQLGLLDRTQAYNSQDITNATNIQNAPMNYWQQFSNQANAIGQGYGTQTQAGGGSNPWVSALGGAQLGRSLANNWGGWGGGSTAETNNSGSSANVTDSMQLYDGSGGWA
jgi:hypothetical protein